MSLSPPADRTSKHTRDVSVCGYHRSDGLWDIEARMTDRKSYPVRNDHRSLEAGAAFHDMALRITVDDTLVIHDVEASIDAAPHRVCPAVTPDFKRVVGLRIGTGFGKELRQLMGDVKGCTHLVELFGPLATTAIQTVSPLRRGALYETDARGDVVAKYWPRFHVALADASAADRLEIEN